MRRWREPTGLGIVAAARGKLQAGAFAPLGAVGPIGVAYRRRCVLLHPRAKVCGA